MFLTPLDLETLRLAEKLAEQEAERAAEEIKMDECIAKMDESIAKMRAQVEMRAKLEAEAKLKLEKQVTSWCMLQGRKSALLAVHSVTSSAVHPNKCFCSFVIQI